MVGPPCQWGVPGSQGSWGLVGHGVSSALPHTRMLGSSQSQTGSSVPTLPPHPLILGADLAGTPQPCCGVRGALGCCSPIQPPSKQPPVPGNASHWVIWTQAGMWGPARKSLFFSGYHQLVPAQENRNWQTGGKMLGLNLAGGGEPSSEQHKGLPRLLSPSRVHPAR